jgi:very-short-patch-repair endonuclease
VVLGAGLTGFRPQEPVELAPGWVRVDLADEASRTILEADSFAWHGSRSALERDCRRYDEAVRNDWVVLRAAWEHVMFEQDWLARLIQDVVALRRAGREERRPRRSPSGPR